MLDLYNIIYFIFLSNSAQELVIKEKSNYLRVTGHQIKQFKKHIPLYSKLGCCGLVFFSCRPARLMGLHNFGIDEPWQLQFHDLLHWGVLMNISVSAMLLDFLKAAPT